MDRDTIIALAAKGAFNSTINKRIDAGGDPVTVVMSYRAYTGVAERARKAGVDPKEVQKLMRLGASEEEAILQTRGVMAKRQRRTTRSPHRAQVGTPQSERPTAKAREAGVDVLKMRRLMQKGLTVDEAVAELKQAV